MRSFEKAMRQNGDPEKVTMDKSGANKAAIDEINQRRDSLHRRRREAILRRTILRACRLTPSGGTACLDNTRQIRQRLVNATEPDFALILVRNAVGENVTLVAYCDCCVRKPGIYGDPKRPTPRSPEA